MELNNRKNEVKAEAKMRSIGIEVRFLPCPSLQFAFYSSILYFGIQELIHKATVKISDLRWGGVTLTIAHFISALYFSSLIATPGSLQSSQD
jgi:hypothetical protein